MSEHDEKQVAGDERLYVPHPEGWSAHVKRSSDKEYCYIKNPGEEFFHLLVIGEIYVERNGERLCLNCALRRGELTRNRTHWKRGD